MARLKKDNSSLTLTSHQISDSRKFCLTRGMKTYWRYGTLLTLTILTIWGLGRPMVNLDFMDSVYVNTWCDMEKCFDATRCRQGPYKHYVYPVGVLEPPNALLPVSDRYRNVLEILGWNIKLFSLNCYIT